MSDDLAALTATPPRSLFVYYRVPLANQAAARQAINVIQQRLHEEHPGLTTRLMQRADTPEGSPEATWMEVYEHPDGVSAVCEARLRDLADALPHGLIGARHVETFCPMAGRP